MLSRELTKEVKRQIDAIFALQLSNKSYLTSNDDMSNEYLVNIAIMRFKSALISYCERQQNCIVVIPRYDTNGQWLSALSFITFNTTNIEHAKQLEIVISNSFDSFDVYELYQIGPKKLVFTFKNI